MATFLNRALLVALDEQSGIAPIEGYRYLQYDHDEDEDQVYMLIADQHTDQVFRAPMELVREGHVLLVGDERVWDVVYIEESGEEMVEVFPVVNWNHA
jgi:hypothetical protein